MKYQFGFGALLLCACLTADAAAQIGIGSVIPLEPEPGQICLIKRVRVNNVIPGQTTVVGQECLYKSAAYAERTSTINSTDLYREEPLPETWSTRTVGYTDDSAALAFQQRAFLEMGGGIIAAESSVGLPSALSLNALNGESIGMGEGIAFGLLNNTSVRLIQTVKFHNWKKKQLVIRFQLFDSVAGNWKEFKAQAVNLNGICIAGVEDVDIILDWNNDSAVISDLGFGIHGCKLRVVAEFVDNIEGKKTVELSKEIPLWFSSF